MKLPNLDMFTREFTFGLAVGVNVVASVLDLLAGSWHMLILTTTVLVALIIARTIFVGVNRKLDAQIGIAEAQRAQAETMLAQLNKAIAEGRMQIHLAEAGDEVRH